MADLLTEQFITLVELARAGGWLDEAETRRVLALKSPHSSPPEDRAFVSDLWFAIFCHPKRRPLVAPPSAPVVQRSGAPAAKEDQSEIRGVLKDLCRLSKGLSEWECDFVDSVARQVDQGRVLSPKQVARVQAIWDKVG